MTYQTALVLEALAAGREHGWDIMDATDLPSGTVYPILRRIEEEGWCGPSGSARATARREQRPPRRYYELTVAGHARLGEARARFRAMADARRPHGAALEAGMMLHLSLAILRLFARLVPSRYRDAWLQEWESELRARRSRLAMQGAITRYEEIDMLRRVLGSFHDAAWLRRQFTLDADIVHDLKHGMRVWRRHPASTLLTVTVLALGIGATTGIYTVSMRCWFDSCPIAIQNASCSCSKLIPPIAEPSR